MKNHWCIIIPVFNNEKTVGEVLRSVLRITGDVIVVNDGSTDHSLIEIENIANCHTPECLRADEDMSDNPESCNLQIISYAKNKGKGFALRKGFDLASRNGYTYAITLDADGQHDPEEIPGFLDVMDQEPACLAVGNRNIKRSEQKKGPSFANRFADFWFRFLTGISSVDTQSGFRLYPLKSLQHIRFFTSRYEFELEVLVRAAWRGVPLKTIPVSVYYPDKNARVTHFRPFRDFMRISLVNTVLVFIALFYIKPFYFFRYLKKENISRFVKKHIIHTQDSPTKTTLSVMFGVFMGIVPIWGYQMVTALALAWLLRLNKFIVIVASNISIPPMIPFILYSSYLTGGLVLQTDNYLSLRASDLTFEFIKNNLYQYIVGSFIFAAIASLCIGLITFLSLRIFRKERVLID